MNDESRVLDPASDVVVGTTDKNSVTRCTDTISETRCYRPRLRPHRPDPHWTDELGRRRRYQASRRCEVLHDGRQDPDQHQHFRFVVPTRCPFDMSPEGVEAERRRLIAMGIPFPETVVMIGPVAA